MNPIGFISSPFKQKNGTPRQPSICAQSKGSLTILKSVFPNPEHALDGLEAFSHIWVMFLFHMNNNKYTKAKVRPPRLNGVKVGVFSTRSPYRPNPIGLTLAKIEKIEGATIYISGIDMLDGTPVLDIKPYIYDYDLPRSYGQHEQQGASDVNKEIKQCFQLDSDVHSKNIGIKDEMSFLQPTEMCMSRGGDKNQQGESQLDNVCITDTSLSDENTAFQTQMNVKEEKLSSDLLTSAEAITQAGWISAPPISKLDVRFSPTATKELEMFSKSSSNPHYVFSHFDSVQDAKNAIAKILQADPRSPYRRTKCTDKLYYFAIDSFHVTAWFDDDVNVAEVLKVKPVSLSKLTYLTELESEETNK
ncbi:tRNA (adenine(37)-N6)-methyltransferase [Lingula anatina]|uniref:tRNA (Adenine(37)-N6)-methyltransferase n=1 Tax=Lingula anatina TaxID=7574 RepID=A0A1S3HV36_LINAN|nr:tRNA (adenine(37)-N6)-methyltransferase [Lingula anatina]XP_013389905.1 tRNA (adenine(37)-N6)-methyltransferase [Lingula anatina]|eukprot:XP_013389904.1 tRNA (adenine(37)-N6)-methyltransferase [Lingula anatina]